MGILERTANKRRLMRLLLGLTEPRIERGCPGYGKRSGGAAER